MSATVRVLAAVIVRDEQYLLGLRPEGKRHAGQWEFPGGKVEAGESDHDALARELREELGVTLIALGAERFVQRDGDSVFEITFVDARIDGEPQSIEHARVAWIALNDLSSYSLAPSDYAFVQSLLR